MKLTFDRSKYLSNPDVFEARGLEEVDHELCEFNDHIEDIAYELAYTRYALAKAEAKLHNIEEGLKRLDKMLVDNFQFACWDGFIRLYGPVHLGIHDARRRTIEAPTLSLLIYKILTGGK